jgi:ankyrin repeat protein
VVKEGDIEVFERATELINEHLARQAEQPRRHSKGKGEEAPAIEPAGEITFHDTIGAHDISVAHVLNSQGFIEWVDTYLKSAGVENPKIPEELKTVIAEYLEEGFGWFVFDVVQLDSEPKTNEAIQYRFNTPFLYYPLKITRTEVGDTTVDLLILTSVIVEHEYAFTGISEDRIDFPHDPIAITREELHYLNKEMYELFEQPSNIRTWLRLWQIRGELSSFVDDLIVGYLAGGEITSLDEYNMMIELLDAVYRGNTEAVKTLLDEGADVNVKDYNDFTALMRATMQGNTETIEVLLDAGADMNAKANDGWTALMYAVRQGYIEIMKVLLDAGAAVNAKANDGWTALIYAARQGHIETMKVLLDAGADVNVVDNNGWTALMYAARQGRIETMKVLLDAGADVNVVDNNGRTALVRAAVSGNAEVVNVLLEAGVGVNAKADDGWTALMYAARQGHIETMNSLLDAGADVNVKAEGGWTALMNAAMSGNTEVVKILLEAGADVNAVTDNGLTALMLAKKRGHREIVQLIRKSRRR